MADPPRNMEVRGGQGHAFGDYNTIYNYFQASQNRLIAIKAISFLALIESKTRDFVGRRFVFDAIDDFIRRNDSGYLVISGEPGIGKTALMAQLVKTRGYPHHFNVSQDNIRSTEQFLESACAQLIARYQLPYKQFPEGVSRDNSFLGKLLQEAAAAPERRPVVLLVDALDEAERDRLATRNNLLYLPSSLPKGVYLIVTTRPLSDLRLSVDPPPQHLFLQPDSSGNLADIRAYIKTFLQHEPALQRRIKRWEISPATFINKLVRKSEGNFIFLRFVLPAIAAGKFKHGTVEDLPQGLQNYYQDHWRQIQASVGAEFSTIYAPVVCVLAVALEPVSVQQVAQWTKLPPAKVLSAVRIWREFLEEHQSGPETRYRLYHTSFKDFLERQVKLEQYDVLIYELYLKNLKLK